MVQYDFMIGHEGSINFIPNVDQCDRGEPIILDDREQTYVIKPSHTIDFNGQFGHLDKAIQVKVEKRDLSNHSNTRRCRALSNGAHLFWIKCEHPDYLHEFNHSVDSDTENMILHALRDASKNSDQENNLP